MTESRRRFFTWLFEEKFPFGQATLMILSNSDRPSVMVLLEKIGMMKYFPPENIFTPESFGGIGKPSSEAFRRPLASKDIDPKSAVMFGNSYHVDVPAAQWMDVVWMPDENETAGKRAIKKNLGASVYPYILRINKIEQAQARVDARFVFKK
jgi:FMN phosphatase YigB (HAD superfamily)